MKNEMKLKREKKKGLRTTLIVHGILLALALMPFMNEAEMLDLTAESNIEIQFVYADISSGAGSTAPKEVVVPEFVEEKELVKKAVENTPVESAPVMTTNEPSDIVVEEIEENSIEEVVLEKVSEEVAEIEDAAEEEEAVVVEKEVEGSIKDSNSEKGEGEIGEEMTGKKLGTLDFDGDGVFGRRVVYRADVKKIAEKEGKIVVNLCINKEGFVTHVAFNKEGSTLNDSEYVKRAMDVASDYLFAKDYTAPATQCGKLTFIFYID